MRLERLESGHLAAFGDVELRDDLELPEGSGWSMTREVATYPADSTRRGDLAIVLDQAAFSVEDFRSAIPLESAPAPIDVVEAELRHLTPDDLNNLIILWGLKGIVGGSAFKAFLWLLEQLESYLTSRQAAGAQPVRVQFHLDQPISGVQCKVIFVVDQDDIRAFAHLDVFQSKLEGYVREQVGESVVKRVSIRFSRTSDDFVIDHIVDSNGRTIPINRP